MPSNSEKIWHRLTTLRPSAISLPIVSVLGSIALAASMFTASAREIPNVQIPSAPWVPYQLKAQTTDDTPKFIEQRPFVLNASHDYFDTARAHLFLYLTGVELENIDDIISSNCTGHPWWAYIYDTTNLEAPITKDRFYMGPALRSIERMREEWHNEIAPTSIAFVYLQTPPLDDGCQIFIDGRAGENGQNQLYTEYLTRSQQPTPSSASSASSASSVSSLIDPDPDDDGVQSYADNCPNHANPEQLDTDADAEGDVCDPDDDNDGVLDTSDNCPRIANPDQENTYGDDHGDACEEKGAEPVQTVLLVPSLELEKTGKNTFIAHTRNILSAQVQIWIIRAREYVDGNFSEFDLNLESNQAQITMPDIPNGEFEVVLYNKELQEFYSPGALATKRGREVTEFSEGVIEYPAFAREVSNLDQDGDEILDAVDNCPMVANPGQADSDLDGLGDACDADLDNDDVLNDEDLCSYEPPLEGTSDRIGVGPDKDADDIGDRCDEDLDGDQHLNEFDNCPEDHNPEQTNSDALDDGGDACDDDDDEDGRPDTSDNCSLIHNPDQEDLDQDGIGDPCDPDGDGDGTENEQDNCPVDANPEQLDTDADAEGDVCDPDDDGDGIADTADLCPLTADPSNVDTDSDELGDACDPDDDNDGILDAQANQTTIAVAGTSDSGVVGEHAQLDNCPLIANPDQADFDGDGIGDVCDPDDDGDDVDDNEDNCLLLSNPEQTDTDDDGDGDACDTDDDGDGLADTADLCPLIADSSNMDSDSDSIGNVCDPDDDNDSVPDEADRCPLIADSSNVDTDDDGAGNVCDDDDDGDGIADTVDSCPLAADSSDTDTDSDGIGDACDSDDDNDGLPDTTDHCPLIADPSNADLDEDGQGDPCDPDDDNDTVPDVEDNCPRTANTEQEDTDEDNIGDVCEQDTDQDGVIDDIDNCPQDPNTDQSDLEGDGVGDVCDNDLDNDNHQNDDDNCPYTANPQQTDTDEDEEGDACDPDDDDDGILDGPDNCELIVNVSQQDTDGDDIGDPCDPDDDGDSVPDEDDLCPLIPDPSNVDTDDDGTGNVCDDDDDGDGLADAADRCPLIPDPSNADADGDDIGDPCDPDIDGDHLSNEEDNCPTDANPGQADLDEDEIGDVCDPDDDNDTIPDTEDTCPRTADDSNLNTDGANDGGDVCDDDDDNDGVKDELTIMIPGLVASAVPLTTTIRDNCPKASNTDQSDIDQDTIGDACDPNIDGDPHDNDDDNCPSHPNPEQTDSDGDGEGDACDVDTDGDGVNNSADNCPTRSNPQQENLDEDDLGDLCDPDIDGDGVLEEGVDEDNDGEIDPGSIDNCPTDANPLQTDTDSDEVGDVCDPDDDDDEILDDDDNCPLHSNPIPDGQDAQIDTDEDGQGDICDPDDDQDGILDTADRCPLTADSSNADSDSDSVGNVCDPDDDNDGIADEADLCPLIADSSNLDSDSDSVGDVCDDDDDGDGIADAADRCPLIADSSNRDSDSDGVGNACDPDDDNDGILDTAPDPSDQSVRADNCPLVANPDQADLDQDNIGDLCDTDPDGDGDIGDDDNCPMTPNADQADLDGDGIGDPCDEDSDADGIPNTEDRCPLDPEASQADNEGDGLGDDCDPDDDNDGIADTADLCPLTADPSNTDTDEDDIGDVCDPDDDNDEIPDVQDNCPLDPEASQTDTDNDGDGDDCEDDDDNDGEIDEEDNCPLTANADQEDSDDDDIGDACDDDDDGDGLADTADHCPLTADSSNADLDGDGIGNVCDPDDDNDGTSDEEDNCPMDANADQSDNDGDEVGDVCDPDDDNDGEIDEEDNCPMDANADQSDNDEDEVGDVCDPDDDNDGIADESDSCPLIADRSNIDTDEDGQGDACDPDDDNDGIEDEDDICALDPENADSDGDSVLNCIDDCPLDPDKEAPGVCGCGLPDDLDIDEDGEVDCGEPDGEALPDQHVSPFQNQPIVVPTDAVQEIQTSAFDQALERIARWSSILTAQVTTTDNEVEEEVAYDDPPESEVSNLALKADYQFALLVDEKCFYLRRRTSSEQYFFDAYITVPDQLNLRDRIATRIHSVSFDRPQPYKRIWEEIQNDDCIDGLTEFAGDEVQIFEDTPATGSDAYLDQIKYEESKQQFDRLTGSQHQKKTVDVAVIDTGYDFDNEDRTGLYGELLHGSNFSPRIDYFHSLFNGAITITNHQGNSELDGEHPSVPQDTMGHGTSVSSIIVANANNTTGMRGIAPEVTKLIPIKIARDTNQLGRLKVGHLYEMIRQATNLGADVINMSLSTSSDLCHSMLGHIISEAMNRGVFFVFSAGNGVKVDRNGANIPGRLYNPGRDDLPVYASNASPGCMGSDLKGALSVASLDTGENTLAWHSNYGETVEIAAPGTGIATYGLEDEISGMDGTSFAAPQVTAAVALTISALKDMGMTRPDPGYVEDVMLNASPVKEELTGVINGGRVLDLKALADYLDTLKDMTAEQRLRIPYHNPREGQGWKPDEDIKKLHSLVITPTKSALVPGEETQFTATVFRTDGTYEDVTARTFFSTSNRTLASITNPGGHVKISPEAESGRQYRIIGHYEGLESEIMLNVIHPREDLSAGPIATLQISLAGGRVFDVSTTNMPANMSLWIVNRGQRNPDRNYVQIDLQAGDFEGQITFPSLPSRQTDFVLYNLSTQRFYEPGIPVTRNGNNFTVLPPEDPVTITGLGGSNTSISDLALVLDVPDALPWGEIVNPVRALASFTVTYQTEDGTTATMRVRNRDVTYQARWSTSAPEELVAIDSAPGILSTVDAYGGRRYTITARLMDISVQKEILVTPRELQKSFIHSPLGTSVFVGDPITVQYYLRLADDLNDRSLRMDWESLTSGLTVETQDSQEATVNTTPLPIGDYTLRASGTYKGMGADTPISSLFTFAVTDQFEDLTIFGNEEFNPGDRFTFTLRRRDEGNRFVNVNQSEVEWSTSDPVRLPINEYGTIFPGPGSVAPNGGDISYDVIANFRGTEVRENVNVTRRDTATGDLSETAFIRLTGRDHGPIPEIVTWEDHSWNEYRAEFEVWKYRRDGGRTNITDRIASISFDDGRIRKVGRAYHVPYHYNAGFSTKVHANYTDFAGNAFHAESMVTVPEYPLRNIWWNVRRYYPHVSETVSMRKDGVHEATVSEDVYENKPYRIEVYGFCTFYDPVEQKERYYQCPYNRNDSSITITPDLTTKTIWSIGIDPAENEKGTYLIDYQGIHRGMVEDTPLRSKLELTLDGDLIVPQPIGFRLRHYSHVTQGHYEKNTPGVRGYVDYNHSAPSRGVRNTDPIVFMVKDSDGNLVENSGIYPGIENGIYAVVWGEGLEGDTYTITATHTDLEISDSVEMPIGGIQEFTPASEETDFPTGEHIPTKERTNFCDNADRRRDTAFAGGHGTKDDPFRICTATQLKNLQTLLEQESTQERLSVHSAHLSDMCRNASHGSQSEYHFFDLEQGRSDRDCIFGYVKIMDHLDFCPPDASGPCYPKIEPIVLNGIDITFEDSPSARFNPMRVPVFYELDGGGYEIRNLIIDDQEQDEQGLFQFDPEFFVRRDRHDYRKNRLVSFKDIVFKEPIVKGREVVGVLMGDAVYIKQFLAKNIQIVGGLVQGDRNVGGLIGRTSSQVNDRPTFDLDRISVIDTDIRFKRDNIGGVIGFHNPYRSERMTRIYSSADIKSIGFPGNQQDIGGIVGHYHGQGVNRQNFKIEEGTYHDPDFRDYNKIENVVFEGSIDVEHADSGANVGGVVGVSWGHAAVSIVHARVNANLLALGSNVGGIVGKIENCNRYTYDCLIYDAVFNGRIWGGQNRDGASNAGGIVGYANQGVIVNSRAIGEVKGVRGVGGIAGLVQNGVLMNDVDSCMNVQSSTTYLGGLIGKMEHRTLDYKNTDGTAGTKKYYPAQYLQNGVRWRTSETQAEFDAGYASAWGGGTEARDITFDDPDVLRNEDLVCE